jgi:AraC-like DNA-binding protein/quercetin dioxygenase-like cupin family protein
MAGIAFSRQKSLNAAMVVRSPRILHIGRIAPDPRWRMASHSHANHELIVIERGAMRVTGAGMDADCREGDVLLYPAHAAHAERSDPDDPVESVFLGFDATEVGFRELVLLRDPRGRAREMARWLHEDRLHPDPRHRASRQALLMALFAELTDGPWEGADTLVETTRRWVIRHIGEPLTLEGLARRAGLSRCHFLRRYKRAAGRTPMQDVRAIRADHARSLLLGTGLTLKEIAPLAGFGDEFALSRAFRRAFGVNASSIRRFHGARSGH